MAGLPRDEKHYEVWQHWLPPAYILFVEHEMSRLGISGWEVIRTALSQSKEWTAYQRVLARMEREELAARRRR